MTLKWNSVCPECIIFCNFKNVPYISLLILFLPIIRFLTVFYYLNEPKLGGETAFPIADNDTLPENEVRENSD